MRTVSADPSSGILNAAAILAGSVGVGVVLLCLGPRLSTIALSLLGIVSVLVPGVRTRLRARLVPSVGAIVVALLVAYLLANASWSIDPAAAYRKVATLLVLGFFCLSVVTAVWQIDDSTSKMIAKAFVIAFGVGMVLLIIELASGLRVTRATYNLMPFLRPEGGKHLIVEDGRVTYLGTYLLNRNVGLVSLLAWPAAALFLSCWDAQGRKWLGLLLLGLVVAVIAMSQHETSKIALVIGALVVATALYAERAVFWFLAAIWCAGFLLIIPLASASYDRLELHKAEWLPYTAKARIIIWGYTAARVPEKLWLGVGVRSTRALDVGAVEDHAKPAGHVVAPRTGRHAHNLFLQTWFEMGLLGVGLVILAGLALLKRISITAPRVRPFGYGLFASSMVVAAFAWGMWQTWLIATYGLVTVCFALACALQAHRESHFSQKSADF